MLNAAKQNVGAALQRFFGQINPNPKPRRGCEFGLSFESRLIEALKDPQGASVSWGDPQPVNDGEYAALSIKCSVEDAIRLQQSVSNLERPDRESLIEFMVVHWATLNLRGEQPRDH